MKKICHLVLALTLISAVCAAVLATVDSVTRSQIARIREKAALDAAKCVMPAVYEVAPLPAKSGEAPSYVGKNKLGKAVAYAIVGRDGKGYNGDIVLMVGFTPEKKIIAYRKLEAAETPGLGSNLVSEEFTKQFRGMDASSDLYVTKDGGKVEAIASATITSRAVCRAINDARRRLEALGAK